MASSFTTTPGSGAFSGPLGLRKNQQPAPPTNATTRSSTTSFFLPPPLASAGSCPTWLSAVFGMSTTLMSRPSSGSVPVVPEDLCEKLAGVLGGRGDDHQVDPLVQRGGTRQRRVAQ